MEKSLLFLDLFLPEEDVLIPFHESLDPVLLDLFDPVALESQILLFQLDPLDPLVLLPDLGLNLVLHLLILLHERLFQQLLPFLTIHLDSPLLDLATAFSLLQTHFLLLPHLTVSLLVEEILLVLDVLLGFHLTLQQFRVFLDLLLHLILLLGLHQSNLQVFLLLLHHLLLVHLLVLIQP